MHGHEEEHDIHSVHDESSQESQLKGQVGVVVEGVEHPSLGLAIDEVHIDT